MLGRDRGDWIGLGLGLALLVSCASEGDLDTSKGGQGEIEVAPTQIDFGAPEVGTLSSTVVTVTNAGTATLEDIELSLDGSGAFSVTTEGMLSALAPGGSTEFIVNYQASGVFDAGTLTVLSSDADDPVIDLVGGPTDPRLVWRPETLDFGFVEVGQRPTEVVTVENQGREDLIIESFHLVGDEFEADFLVTPLTLGPGETLGFEVAFVAESAGSFTGTISATANASEDLEMELRGVAYSGPVAVCSVDPEQVSSHGVPTTWIGEASFDPHGGQIVDYEWTLYARPEGSAAVMPEGGANRSAFDWDMAGEYVGMLVVTNDAGEVSEPCYATLTATPVDDFWIEMYWVEYGDDMDLHLLAPGGALETITDCYYATCASGYSLDWGVLGVEEDNPSLDLDDIEGAGPENIRIAEPQDGQFTVIVHDYPYSVFEDPNWVRVLIYIGGVMRYDEYCYISGEDTYTEFATVDFPEGRVTSLGPCEP